jgi:hypothetical protein
MHRPAAAPRFKISVRIVQESANRPALPQGWCNVVKINEPQNQQHQRKANQISLSCRLEASGRLYPHLSSLIKAVFHVEPVHVQLGSSSAETCDFVCHRLLNSNFKKLFDNGRHTSQENTWSVC